MTDVLQRPVRRVGPQSALLPGPIRFGLVGGSGLVVNLVVLGALLALGGGEVGVGWHAVAATVATHVAILWNFLLTEGWVFPGRRGGSRRRVRLAGYWLLSVGGLAVQLPLAAELAAVLPVGYLGATATSLATLGALRYAACRTVLYRDRCWFGRESGAPRSGYGLPWWSRKPLPRAVRCAGW